MDFVTIYSDGSARCNPGRGGYGTVLISGVHRKELSEGFRMTTNNRMELLGVIKGLEALKRPCNVTIYSDSKYVVDAVEKNWLQGWIKIGFKGKKNRDLWLRYADVATKHNINFIWVKGHAGNVENERCDTLATAAADSANLLIDDFFENEQNSSSLNL